LKDNNYQIFLNMARSS